MHSHSWPANASQKRFYIVSFVIFFIGGFLLWKSTRPNNDNVHRITPEPRLFYFQNGTIYPQPANFSKELGRRDAKLLPFEDPDGDRWLNQLMFVPPNYEEIKRSKKRKLLNFHVGYEAWFMDTRDFTRYRDTFFERRGCPVSTCSITNKREEMEKSDLIFCSGVDEPIKNLTRTPNQIYVYYRLESPVHWTTRVTKAIPYNWTVTYRHDSTVPNPYYKWAYYDPNVKEIPQTINYAANKTKKVAWLVSNCEIENDRLSMVHALQKYIQVDIYGKCGTLHCSKTDYNTDTYQCLDIFEKDYKFYLAYENSNCADYITEKLYRNALGRKILPIVLGARREDYERQAPHGSYIFAEDFTSPKALAEYLHKLDQDDDLYNSYFKWKGTGEFLDKFDWLWCRLCAMLHDEYSMVPSWYDDINEWWFDPKVWKRGFWRDSNK